MGCERGAWGALVVTLLSTSSARADPIIVAAQALYESPMLVVPVALFASSSEAGEVRASQMGWTTSAHVEMVRTPTLSLVGTIDATPLYAHASNRVYRGGSEDASLEFRDTAVQPTWGLAWHSGVHAHADLRWTALKEWVDGIAERDASMWRRAYWGAQTSLSLAWTRSDDPMRFRWDGFKVFARAQGLVGEVPWWLGEADLGIGRRLGPLFAMANACGVYESASSSVARWIVGGSWDALGGQAVWGHPYGELRVDCAAIAGARLDLVTMRDVELGVRAAAMASRDGTTHGEAVQLSAAIAGVLVQAGVAAPDGEVKRALVFAAASAATFL
jgi:hypothetical protein